MKFEELFDQRSIVAMKLKDYIRERGFTKVSFAKKAEISRPTLDKILNGSIDGRNRSAVRDTDFVIPADKIPGPLLV